MTLDPGIELFEEVGQEPHPSLDLAAEIHHHLAGFLEDVLLIVASAVAKAVPEQSQAILGGNNTADLFEVEPHEDLELPDTLDALHVCVAVATAAA